MNTKNCPKRLNKLSQCELANKLNSVCDMLDELYNINQGGCCYVAYCIASLLFKDGYDFRVVVFSDEGLKFTDFNDIWDSQYHYAIEFQDVFINGESYKEDTPYSILEINNPEVLKKHYRKFSWNDYYLKRKNNFIRKIIINFYTDLIKDLYESQ